MDLGFILTIFFFKLLKLLTHHKYDDGGAVSGAHGPYRHIWVTRAAATRTPQMYYLALQSITGEDKQTHQFPIPRIQDLVSKDFQTLSQSVYPQSKTGTNSLIMFPELHL